MLREAVAANDDTARSLRIRSLLSLTTNWGSLQSAFTAPWKAAGGRMLWEEASRNNTIGRAPSLGHPTMNPGNLSGARLGRGMRGA